MGGADTSFNQDKTRTHLDTVFFQRIAAGDQTAFAVLVSQYSKVVYSVAYRLTRSVPLSEEIVQDVFLKIWLKRAMLVDVVNFPAFLYTVSTNIIYSTLRQQQRDVLSIHATDIEAHQPAVNATEDIVQDREYAGLLEKAIRRLPERQQQTYILIKKEGMKRDAAAAAMNISPETVKSNLEQAMKNIRAFCLANLDILMIIIWLIL
ncbi:sigma-70 family RNA polymerase sigma factor [Chitinophaga sancti]|uniref:RNA polymerase sigma factor n=1 Tax=Chitinophaga sancti TaxID=1004 RepID=UPI002A74ABA5|nr:sigma-70 family RNA polymerase sigma factor [Chitinophaga sancti]WPQ64542.1 sigma-70 family RNA polymerase sigma factor [Chitinophaga sancti]